jgi:hypothetical protein
MRNSMSVSNVEYAVLKKKSGLHNWGFSQPKDRFDFDLDELEDLLGDVIVIEEFAE